MYWSFCLVLGKFKFFCEVNQLISIWRVSSKENNWVQYKQTTLFLMSHSKKKRLRSDFLSSLLNTPKTQVCNPLIICLKIQTTRRYASLIELHDAALNVSPLMHPCRLRPSPSQSVYERPHSTAKYTSKINKVASKIFQWNYSKV